jgi:RNA polymerase sigma-70 factor, ECF subfamily
MVQAHSADDWLLVKAIGQQDQGALSRLYDRYARVLYALAFKMLGSVEEAEEVVLDVFSKVWSSAASYDASRGRVDNWLFMMTRSRTLDRLRSRQRRDRVMDVSMQQAQVEIHVQRPLPQEELVIQERREQVQQALAKIPAEQRLVIEFAYFGGLSQSEIASRTGLSLGTVKTRLRLGLSKLKGLLE